MRLGRGASRPTIRQPMLQTLRGSSALLSYGWCPNATGLGTRLQSAPGGSRLGRAVPGVLALRVAGAEASPGIVHQRLLIIPVGEDLRLHLGVQEILDGGHEGRQPRSVEHVERAVRQ